MSLRKIFQFLVLMIATLLFARESFALKNTLNGYSSPEIDIRSYGVLCDGSTDDYSKFTSAYSTLSAAGGGTLVIPLGKTCMVSQDVTIASNVNLRCEPGGTIKATAGASFTLGMLSSTISTASNNTITGCTFDLNTKKGAALWTAGENIIIEKNYFFNGSTSQASDWDIVRYGCSSNNSTPKSSTCEFNKNRIECASTAGANDIGLNYAGSSDDAQFALIQNNQIIGCDSYGIKSASAVNIVSNGVTGTDYGISSSGSEALIFGNRVKVSGSTGIGINVSGNYSTITQNKIETTGASGIGTYSTGTYVSILGNKLDIAGVTGTAISVTEPGAVIAHNKYILSSADAGTDSGIGIKLGNGGAFDWYYTVQGNIGGITTPEAQVHVMVAGTHSTIVGNLFTGGKYGIVPSQVSSDEYSRSINVIITANRLYSIGGNGGSPIIAITGWIISNNYIAWTPSGSTAAIEINDARTYKSTTSHLNIVGNLIHTSSDGITAIKFNDIGKTCNAGTKIFQTCTTDDTNGSTGCPSATCTGCCVASDTHGVQITGNHLLWWGVSGGGSTGPTIDFSTGVSSTSGDIFSVVIDGNSFFIPGSAAEGDVAIKCSSSNQSKVHDIDIGTNSYEGYTPVTGDTSEGRLDLNCTPDMVDDAGTDQFWIPAAGCNGSTGIPFMDLPTSSYPTATCKGTNYSRGVLAFPNAADTSANTNIFFSDLNKRQFFVKPIFTVEANNSLYTRWAFAGNCILDNSDPSSSWGSDNNLDTPYNGTSLQMEVPTSYSTIGAITCNGPGLFSLRVKRVGTNTTSNQDDQTADSLLYGVTLFARRQD